MNLAYIVSGLSVGLLVGLTGVGGGSLMTPLLVFLFGFSPTTAVGTDLLFASITKAGGVAVHHGNHGSVNWKIVRHLSVGSLPAALLVIFCLEYFNIPKSTISSVVTIALGIALILMIARKIWNRMNIPIKINRGGSTYTSQLNPLKGGSASTRSPY